MYTSDDAQENINPFLQQLLAVQVDMMELLYF